MLFWMLSAEIWPGLRVVNTEMELSQFFNSRILAGRRIRQQKDVLRHPRRDVFPPRLVGRDAQRLGRLYLGAILDEALPALPGE